MPRRVCNISSSVGSGKTGGNISSRNYGCGRGATNKSIASRRVFVMTRRDAQATPKVVRGKRSISSRDACVLIDPGFTHSFVSCALSMHLDQPLKFLDTSLVVSTQVGEVMLVETVYKSYVLNIDEKEFYLDLVPLDIQDFDIILGWIGYRHIMLL